MKPAPMSTYEFLKLFPDAESARLYIEGKRWPNGPVCPACGETKRVAKRRGDFYGCNACKLDFTVRTNTVFERSHVPLDKWLAAMFFLLTARKGISSIQLGKELGITQKSAWFMLHRIREACGKEMTALRGIIEVDETVVGGREKNKHASKQRFGGTGATGKSVVLGMRERGGRIKAMPIEAATTAILTNAILANVESGSMIHSDEHKGYIGVKGLSFGHATVNHSLGRYSENGVTTNGIESVWAVLKRGLHGVYHHASPKHLARYVNEFTFRLNEGSVKRPRMDRLSDLVGATFGKHLTYRRLVDLPR